MKKCPYCGYENDEQAESCSHCKAGIPHEEQNNKNPEGEEPVGASKRKRRGE